ncbi:DUF177 domain-containing protein [Joostella atrarenae]|uniref:DUF177 domain-containing protein n=1 Tax=Joostella atrarenae TaxID=679257 RepID=A0ABS9IZD2_9FLAO|nr:DUF177 domain-containing protein [Joostella atrarenae]MCF8713543.1 DUF177 domain-containing protein [Joostella atrarenae]
MKKLKEFDIPFIGLKEGKHQFNFEIDKKFFDAFEFEDFNDAAVAVKFTLDKKSNMLELTFKANGSVNVYCDLSNEPYDQEVKGKLHLLVQFGEEYNDDNEEILIIPHSEHQINVAQYIYEMIVLSVPNKRIHPGVEDGTLATETLKKLEAFQPKEEKESNDGETDPRWDQLKKLLTDK